MAADSAAMTAHAREQVLSCDVNEKKLGGGVVTVAVVTAATVAATVGRWRPWEPFATFACAPEGEKGAYKGAGARGTQHGGIDGGSSHRWVGICYPAPQRLIRVQDRAECPI
jgi:hypothetical protein